MAEITKSHAGNKPSLKRRDVLKAGMAGAATLAMHPGSLLTAQTAQEKESKSGAPKIIDIHPHIASADTTKYPIAPVGGKRSDWSKERSVTFEQMIVAMDEAGIAKAAFVQSSTTYGNDCSQWTCLLPMPSTR